MIKNEVLCVFLTQIICKFKINPLNFASELHKAFFDMLIHPKT